MTKPMLGLSLHLSMPACTQVCACAPAGPKISAVMINIADRTYCRKQLSRIPIPSIGYSVAIAQRSGIGLWWGTVVVIALKTPKRIQRASLSAELHDRAIGAERTRAAAESLDRPDR